MRHTVTTKEPSWILMPNRVEPDGYTDPSMAHRPGVKPIPAPELRLSYWTVLLAVLVIGLGVVGNRLVRLVRLICRETTSELSWQRRQLGRTLSDHLAAIMSPLISTKNFSFCLGG